ncbi:hypothetical protein FS837_003776 [Tulasnella sp. UAMH 9824]|nr:hypothetical protein FS837_003776 [Tulasnella sp. UAMH 9824]
MTEMPDLPKEFGDDGGHFYKYYDKLAEESDETLVKNLKAQLDGILIFAGLFAGVNSTFLVFTLPQLSANPADDTNALLLQIALGVNSSITSKADLPSASFTPPPRIYLVNVLFSVSLMLALCSSLLAVFGQQWIVYYRKRGAGGAEDRRWELLQRYLGAKRWRLELVLDDLVPSLLQLGLVIFCIAFALHLKTVSQSLNRIIAWLLYVAGATNFAMATSAAFDPWCPFTQPLSRIARSVASAILAFAVSSAYCSSTLFLLIAGRSINAIWPKVAERQVQIPGGALAAVKVAIAYFADRYRSLTSAGFRSAKDPGDLKVEALRRVMCTSEDRDALIYAAINLQVLRDERALSSLARDREFFVRLSILQTVARGETQHGGSSGRYSLIESKVLSNSYFHFIITTCSDPYIFRAYGKLGIQISLVIYTDSEEMSHLLEDKVLALIAHIILENAEDRLFPDLHTAYKSVLGTSAQNHHLRLGFMMASAMLFSREWNDEEWAVLPYRPQNKFLTALFAAYRETSERVMFGTISRALATVSAQWRGKPDHELYVWLFELCLLSEMKSIYEVDQHPVLERVHDHLLSLENWIREEGASEIDGQRGRDYQNRYVQSVARFCVDQNNPSQTTWGLISTPLERYLTSVKELTENHPEHPENSKNMDLLLRMESIFAGPQPVGTSLLNHIGLSVPAKALVSTEVFQELRYMAKAYFAFNYRRTGCKAQLVTTTADVLDFR